MVELDFNTRQVLISDHVLPGQTTRNRFGFLLSPFLKDLGINQMYTRLCGSHFRSRTNNMSIRVVLHILLMEFVKSQFSAPIVRLSLGTCCHLILFFGLYYNKYR